MKYNEFFWLHVKKSAGQTTRQLLQPHYRMVDKVKKPKNFIQTSPEEYNDTLNNYRVVLGDYQFKRVLFATKYLYKDNWNSIFSFAFSRNPMDRCISMFHYLHHRKKSFVVNLINELKNLKHRKRVGFSASYDFDLFLELIERVDHHNFESIYQPIGLHFSTHTAPMFNDITDHDGKILLTKVYRLENLHAGIEQAFEASGLEYDVSKINSVNKNVNKQGRLYKPNELQKRKIYKLYEQDFELFEKAAKIL